MQCWVVIYSFQIRAAEISKAGTGMGVLEAGGQRAVLVRGRDLGAEIKAMKILRKNHSRQEEWHVPGS